MALQFVCIFFFISSSPHSTDIKWSLDLDKVLSPYLLNVSLSTFIWTLSWMWNTPIPKYCLPFTFLLPDWKDSKGKEPPVSLLEHIYGSTPIFWINPCQKMLSRKVNNFDVFYEQYIQKQVIPHCLIRNLNYSLEWNAVRKVCSFKKENIIECMQIFPPGRPTATSGWS